MVKNVNKSLEYIDETANERNIKWSRKIKLSLFLFCCVKWTLNISVVHFYYCFYLTDCSHMSGSLGRRGNMLYNIHFMIYIGVIYNKVSLQVLSDLSHYVSIVLAIYKWLDRLIERTPSRELLERLLLDFLLRDSIRVFTDDIRYMSSVKLFWCEFYNKYEIQLTTYYHTNILYKHLYRLCK